MGDPPGWIDNPGYGQPGQPPRTPAESNPPPVPEDDVTLGVAGPVEDLPVHQAIHFLDLDPAEIDLNALMSAAPSPPPPMLSPPPRDMDDEDPEMRAMDERLAAKANEYNRSWRPPSVDSLVDDLQVAMMNKPDCLEPIPIRYNSHVLYMIEAYRKQKLKIAAAAEKAAVAERELEKEREGVRATAAQWREREENYRKEVKRLELLLAKNSEHGTGAVIMARHDSEVDRAAGRAFRERLRQLGTDQARCQDDEEKNKPKKDDPKKKKTASTRKGGPFKKTMDNLLRRHPDPNRDVILSERIRAMDRAPHLTYSESFQPLSEAGSSSQTTAEEEPRRQRRQVPAINIPTYETRRPYRLRSSAQPDRPVDSSSSSCSSPSPSSFMSVDSLEEERRRGGPWWRVEEDTTGLEMLTSRAYNDTARTVTADAVPISRAASTAHEAQTRATTAAPSSFASEFTQGIHAAPAHTTTVEPPSFNLGVTPRAHETTTRTASAAHPSPNPEAHTSGASIPPTSTAATATTPRSGVESTPGIHGSTTRTPTAGRPNNQPVNPRATYPTHGGLDTTNRNGTEGGQVPGRQRTGPAKEASSSLSHRQRPQVDDRDNRGFSFHAGRDDVLTLNRPVPMATDEATDETSAADGGDSAEPSWEEDIHQISHPVRLRRLPTGFAEAILADSPPVAIVAAETAAQRTSSSAVGPNAASSSLEPGGTTSSALGELAPSTSRGTVVHVAEPSTRRLRRGTQRGSIQSAAHRGGSSSQRTFSDGSQLAGLPPQVPPWGARVNPGGSIRARLQNNNNNASRNSMDSSEGTSTSTASQRRRAPSPPLVSELTRALLAQGSSTTFSTQPAGQGGSTGPSSGVGGTEATATAAARAAARAAASLALSRGNNNKNNREDGGGKVGGRRK